MLEWALQLAPPALVFGALLTVVTIGRRRQTPSWLRYEGWVRGLGRLPSSLYSASWIVCAYLLAALGSWLVVLVTGKPAPFPVGTSLMMAVVIPIVVALLFPFLKAPKEPEDWLLWDKEKTEKR